MPGPAPSFPIPCSPVAVEAEPVHHAAGAERKRIAGLIDDSHEGVGARDSRQPVLGAVTAVHKVCQIPLGKKPKQCHRCRKKPVVLGS